MLRSAPLEPMLRAKPPAWPRALPSARKVVVLVLPKPLLYVIVIAVTSVWVVAAVADMLSTSYDAQGVHLIFGAIVGGLVGLARRDGNGGDKDK